MKMTVRLPHVNLVKQYSYYYNYVLNFIVLKLLYFY